MNKHKLFLGVFLAVALIISIMAVGFLGKVPLARGAVPPAVDTDLTVIEANAPSSGSNLLVLMYSAKFVCTEALPAGTQFYGTAAPIVSQKTEVLVHNPNDFAVTFYRKAVRSTFVDSPPVVPGAWIQYVLGPDYSIKLDCDDVAKLLTGNPSATFIGTYGIGVTVEGFIVIGIGPQTPVPGTMKYINLDVTGEYTRSSEVMKKDVHFQPWWTYWWGWNIPWRLGYPYQRVIPIDISHNIDCRESLLFMLTDDVNNSTMPADQKGATINALMNGRMYEPMGLHEMVDPIPPALVPLIGRCDKIGTTHMSVDYVIFSNSGPTNINPLTGIPPRPVLHPYPWMIGHWYDVPVVMSQNVSVDIDGYYRTWYRQRWLDLDPSMQTDVDYAMSWFAPYWSGWGYWYWWWNGGDSVSIGVGEGESLDVEQIMPTRVNMTTWPPP